MKISIYRVINGIVLIAAAILLYILFKHQSIISVLNNSGMIGICALASCMVLVTKWLRLYILLFGRAISVIDQLKLYCKTVPISMLFPFKTGEIFRMYCYGYYMGDYAEGCACILLDRFSDTVALITIMIGSHFLFQMKISTLLALLIGFVFIIFAVYYTLPYLCAFWKNYFIEHNATKRKIKALYILDAFDRAYSGIVEMGKGKFFILYILSFFAWVVEIGGLMIFNRSIGYGSNQDILVQYLESVLRGRGCNYMKSFSEISIYLVVLLFVALKICSALKNNRRKV